jgi:general secretion pathway protein F
MPRFQYLANDHLGETQKGVLEADNENSALEELSRRQLSPIEVHLKAASLGELKIFRPSYQDDVVLLTRQFSTLLITGVPISEALDALALELDGKAIQPLLLEIKERVQQGDTLYAAMSRFPDCFSPVYLGLIKIGEASGQMAEVLGELSTFLHSQAQLKKQMTGALAYPIVLCCIGTLVVGILVTTVIPTIANVLQEGGQTLPTSTAILMDVSSVLRAVLPFAIPILPFLYYGWKRLMRNRELRLKWHRLIFKLPMLGNLIKKALMARFSLTFAIMLRSGVPALEALEILEETTENLALAHAISTTREGIVSGKDISTQVKQEDVFPPLMSFMISVGEKSGKLDEVLTGVSEHYKEDIEHEISKFTKAFEPIMIVVLAAIVGLIVYSVVSAILEMSNVN